MDELPLFRGKTEELCSSVRTGMIILNDDDDDDDGMMILLMKMCNGLHQHNSL